MEKLEEKETSVFDSNRIKRKLLEYLPIATTHVYKVQLKTH